MKLGDLQDVDITNPQNGDRLLISDGVWRNSSAVLNADVAGGAETLLSQGGKYYRIHTFIVSGDLVVSSESTVEILLVGGGGPGAGGSTFGAGGGGSAGDVVSETITLEAGTYNITIGQRGYCLSQSEATAGGDTTAFSLLARGGGVGGSRNYVATDGGGGADFTNTVGAIHPSGFRGGTGTVGSEASARSAGGGRGTLGDGDDAVSFQGGNGGPGTSSDITGSAVEYGRGGGGGSRTTGGAPNGANSSESGNAGANPGDGGGGGSQSGLGGDGADGTAIIRYEITEAEYAAETA